MSARIRRRARRAVRVALFGVLTALTALGAIGSVAPAGAQGGTVVPLSALVANDLGLIFNYPSDWTAQPLPYLDFGFRLSAPETDTDPIGRPLSGGYLGALVEPQTEADWRTYAPTQPGARFSVAGLEAIEGPITTSELIVRTRTWQIYGFGHRHTLTFGAAPADFDRLLPVARRIVDNLNFIGTVAAAPRPIFSPVRVVALTPLLHAFSAGPGRVMSGYNNGAYHAGGDLYALDFCGGAANCSFMPVGTDVLAPTAMKLVYSLNSLRQDVKDFHFFELAADYGGRRLCMSVGHMQTVLSLNQSVVRGQKIGTILQLDGNANHVHMGMFTVASTANCAQTPRTALPYAAAQGGQPLDGVDYPTSGGSNEWKGTVVTSSNALIGAGTATPTLTRTPTRTATPTLTLTATVTLSGTPPSATPSQTLTPRPDTIGVFKDGVWSLRLTNSAGSADLTVSFGGVGFLPVTGDWNGDGVDTVGVFNPQLGTFSLSDRNTAPAVDYAFVLGNPGDTPFAGRWGADMLGDGVGVYRPTNGILYEKKSLTTGFADYFAIFGNPGDFGVAGDWDGDGLAGVGVYRPSLQRWFLTNNSAPAGITFSDLDFIWDIGAGLPVIGDWNLTGRSTVGSFQAGVFTLHGANATSAPDMAFAFGPADGLPVAGRWAP